MGRRARRRKRGREIRKRGRLGVKIICTKVAVNLNGAHASAVKDHRPNVANNGTTHSITVRFTPSITHTYTH